MSDRFLRLGVVLGARPEGGGAFSYENFLLEALRELEKRQKVRLEVFHEVGNGVLKRARITPNKQEKSDLFSPHRKGRLPIRIRHKEDLDGYFTRFGLDAVYFASPNRLAQSVRKVPYIFTIWDLGHRDLPEFPEYQGREWNIRETLFRESLPRAMHVFTDSRHTGERIESLYGVQSDRWTALGLLLTKGVTDPEPGFLREVGLIEGRYFVCPGNKWWHKNHRVIIRALALLKDFGEIKVVFTGSERGAGPIIRSDATKLGVANQIVDLGHRTYSEVQAVVSGSIAVLMPSLLGPTNLPPLEALAHGKPAIVSSVHDFEPEIQSRLIVLNPSEPSDWAHEMRNLIESPIQAEPFFYASEDEVLTLLSHVIEKFKDRSKIWLASAEFTEDGEKNASGL